MAHLQNLLVLYLAQVIYGAIVDVGIGIICKRFPFLHYAHHNNLIDKFLPTAMGIKSSHRNQRYLSLGLELSQLLVQILLE